MAVDLWAEGWSEAAVPWVGDWSVAVELWEVDWSVEVQAYWKAEGLGYRLVHLLAGEYWSVLGYWWAGVCS